MKIYACYISQYLTKAQKTLCRLEKINNYLVRKPQIFEEKGSDILTDIQLVSKLACLNTSDCAC